MVAYLADNTHREVWGYLIAREVQLDHGTVYPMLNRLQAQGWIDTHPETDTEWRARAPYRRGDRRRCYLKLTPQGAQAAAQLAAR